MASQRLELLASAAQTATGNGGGINVANLRELLVFLNITAVTGTNPQVTVFLQASDDGGSTWYDLPFEISLTDNNASANEGSYGAPDSSAASRVRNICFQAAAVLKAIAQYKMFGDMVRVRWVMAGTTPSFTFDVQAVGKN